MMQLQIQKGGLPINFLRSRFSPEKLPASLVFWKFSLTNESATLPRRIHRHAAPRLTLRRTLLETMVPGVFVSPLESEEAI